MLSPEPLAPSAQVDLGDAVLAVYESEPAAADAPIICAAHPADAFDHATAALLGRVSGARIVCVNPRGLADSSPPPPRYTLDAMVDDLEAARQRMGLGPWFFWGMSGGGWLAQLYARRHPHALRGLLIESACACFRERLADPACLLSPFHPLWRDALAARGLLAATSHAAASDDPCEWLTVPGVGSVFRRIDGPALLVSPAPLSAAMTRVMPELWAFDARAWLGTIQTPTLVLAGTDDPIVPLARARAVHEAIAGSSFVAIDGGAHVPTATESPQSAAAVRAFLKSTGHAV